MTTTTLLESWLGKTSSSSATAASSSSASSYATPGNRRLIVHVDADGFYVGVERLLDPTLRDVPVGVAQYTVGKVLIAVSPEAKKLGVKRGMNGAEALLICPTLKIVQVPSANGKADLTRYRAASDALCEVLGRFCDVVERASIDEFYMDFTHYRFPEEKDDVASEGKTVATQYGDDFFICETFKRLRAFSEAISEKRSPREGKDDDEDEQDETAIHPPLQLQPEDLDLLRVCRHIGEMQAVVSREMRGLSVTAGVAHTKFLAKTLSGLKPRPGSRIVLLPRHVHGLLKTIPLQEAKGFRAKLGEYLTREYDSVEHLADLAELGEATLVRQLGENRGKYCYRLARGEDDEPVENRRAPKSISCSKNFGPRRDSRIRTYAEFASWVRNMTNEIEHRLRLDGRLPRNLTLALWFHPPHRETLGGTRTAAYPRDPDTETLVANYLALFPRFFSSGPVPLEGTNLPFPEIAGMGLAVSNFPEDSTVAANNNNNNSHLPTSKNWTCATCTYENDARFLRCEMCGGVKGASGISSSPPPSKREKVMMSEEEREGMLSLPPSPPAASASRKSSAGINNKWTCSQCTFAENDLKFLRCEVCNGLR